MARTFTGFDNFSDGEALTTAEKGWTQVKGNYVPLVENNSSDLMVEVGPTTSFGKSFFYWSTPGSMTDQEVLIKFKISTLGSQVPVVLRYNSGVSSGSLYEIYLDTTGRYIYAYRWYSGLASSAYVSGYPSGLSSVTVGDWYFLRAKAVGTTLKAKCWKATDSEPKTGGPDNDGWAFKEIDGSIASGYCGVGATWYSNTAIADITSIGSTNDPANEEAPSVPIVDTVYATVNFITAATTSVLELTHIPPVFATVDLYAENTAGQFDLYHIPAILADFDAPLADAYSAFVGQHVPAIYVSADLVTAPAVGVFATSFSANFVGALDASTDASVFSSFFDPTFLQPVGQGVSHIPQASGILSISIPIEGATTPPLAIADGVLSIAYGGSVAVVPSLPPTEGNLSMTLYLTGAAT